MRSITNMSYVLANARHCKAMKVLWKPVGHDSKKCIHPTASKLCPNSNKIKTNDVYFCWIRKEIVRNVRVTQRGQSDCERLATCSLKKIKNDLLNIICIVVLHAIGLPAFVGSANSFSSTNQKL